jgi:hypothetical protein
LTPRRHTKDMVITAWGVRKSRLGRMARQSDRLGLLDW